MAYDQNLQQLRDRKLHYIVASRQPERDRWLADFAAAEGFQPVLREPSPRNPFQKKSRVKVKLVKAGEESLVLCHSEARVAKASRETQEARLAEDLDRLARRDQRGAGWSRRWPKAEAIGRLQERYPRVARTWRIDDRPETKSFTAEPDAQARAKAEALDGCYILRTDRDDLDADEAWRLYMLLSRVENAFRNMKSPLGRSTDLPPARTPRRHPHLSLPARLPPARRHREDPARSGRPHLLGLDPRPPLHPSGRHRRPADQLGRHLAHPKGLDPRARTPPDLPPAQGTRTGHDSQTYLVRALT